MTKTKAIILAFLTILPIAYIVFFITFVINGLINSAINDNSFIFNIILPMHLSTMVLIIILLVIYIKDIFVNKTIESDKRALWAVVILFGTIVAMPIYWYSKIWKPITKKE